MCIRDSYLVNLLFEENRKKAMNDVGNKCFFSLYFSQNTWNNVIILKNEFEKKKAKEIHKKRVNISECLDYWWFHSFLLTPIFSKHVIIKMTAIVMKKNIIFESKCILQNFSFEKNELTTFSLSLSLSVCISLAIYHLSVSEKKCTDRLII